MAKRRAAVEEGQALVRAAKDRACHDTARAAAAPRQRDGGSGAAGGGPQCRAAVVEQQHDSDVGRLRVRAARRPGHLAHVEAALRGQADLPRWPTEHGRVRARGAPDAVTLRRGDRAHVREQAENVLCTAFKALKSPKRLPLHPNCLHYNQAGTWGYQTEQRYHTTLKLDSSE